MAEYNHVVLGRPEGIKTGDTYKYYQTFDSLRERVIDKRDPYDGDYVIIGGEVVYNIFIDDVDEIILTEIDAVFKTDRKFPYFNKEKFNKELILSDTDNGWNFTINRYVRK